MSEVLDSGEATKAGITIIQLTIRRASNGFKLTAKAHPDIEAFARGLGDGETMPVEAYNRDWYADEGSPILIYNMTRAFTENRKYTLTKPGRPFIVPNDYGMVTNLSLLRAQGISVNDGITLGVKGVFDKDELRQVRSNILNYTRELYLEYILPVNIVGNVFAPPEISVSEFTPKVKPTATVIDGVRNLNVPISVRTPRVVEDFEEEEGNVF